MTEPFLILTNLILLVGLVFGYLRTSSLIKETNDKIHYWAKQTSNWQHDANLFQQERNDLRVRLDEARKIAGMDKPAAEVKP